MLDNVSQRRFSTYLMTSIVSLAFFSVLILATVLFFYFNLKLKTEFENKLIAQKGQLELLLENRIEGIKRRLKDLSFDNTIRVTMMLGVASQLEERIKFLYPAQSGSYLFVQNNDTKELYPPSYPDISSDRINEIINAQPHDSNILGDVESGFYILYRAPILRRTDQVGTAYALYGLNEDKELQSKIRQLTGSALAILKAKRVISLDTGIIESSVDVSHVLEKLLQTNFVRIGENKIISQLEGFDSFYFLSTDIILSKQKNQLLLLILLFAIIVIAISIGIAFFLGKKLAMPLQYMADQAIKISEGQKEFLFEKENDFVEINKLSRSFNRMITSIEEEKRRYLDLLENIDDAVYLFDSKGNILDSNEASYKQLGYSAEEFYQLKIKSILPGEDAQQLISLLMRQNKQIEKRRKTLETFHLNSAGKRIPVEINARAIQYSGREVVLNVARDLSSRKEAEEALRQSEEKYRLILENIEECYFEVDFSGRLLFFNKALSNLSGYTQSELQGLSQEKLATKESAADFSEWLKVIRHTGMPVLLEKYIIVPKKGPQKVLELSASLIKSLSGELTGLRCVGRDVTEQTQLESQRRLLEAQLQHSQKLEAIGTLAGGIAHDFNNILAAVLGYTDLAMLETDKNSPIYEILEGIKKGGLRAKDLVSQILAFSRKTETQKTPLDVSVILSEALTMLRATLPATIDIRHDMKRELGLIMADPTQLHQIIMNLCTNAAQAMLGKRGLLEIHLSKTEITKGDLPKCPQLDEGPHVKITVKDTGSGMDQETMSRIFEPFFTTKEKTQGTGMGLAAVHGIVEDHNGCIYVESEVGLGTTFTLFFPIVEGIQQQAETIPVPVSIVKGKGRILFIDDEQDIIVLAKKMLEYLGYEVVAETNSPAALSLFLSDPSAFDLVITDQTMPEMTGTELAQKMLEQNPDLPIILCTGYSEAVNEHEAQLLGIKRFMLKPLAFETLAETVSQLLVQKGETLIQ